MKKTNLNRSVTKWAVVLFTLALINTSCKKNPPEPANPLVGLENFNQVNLVANNASYYASRIDTVLQNAWGISFSPTGNIWLSANVTGYSVVYDKMGTQLLSPVSIPSPKTAGGGAVTGQVFSGAANFLLPNGSPAIFIFATQDGIIAGWNKGKISNAVTKINNSTTASYFGLALASNMGANYIYAANFKQASIDVFDNNWNSVNMKFTDANLPAQYSPFNIQKVGDQLYVLYAKVGADGNEIHAAGLGIGKDSSAFNNTILVGNFGDGHINAYNGSGTFLGPIKSHGKALVVDGLWAISFAPATATSINPNWLYFGAGPNYEKDGLFGYISK